MSKTKQSLYINLGVIVVLTSFTMMSLYASYDYITTKKQITSKIQRDSELSIIALKENVTDFMSAYAVHEYEQLVQSEIERRHNSLAIIVEDFNMGEMLGVASFVSGKIRDSDWNVIEYDPESIEQNKLLEEYYLVSRDTITNSEGGKVGAITIYTSDRFLKIELRKAINETIIQVFIITLLLTFILIAFLRNFILKPLSDIVAVISTSDTDGIPKEEIPTHSSKEISSLALSMNTMIASIQRSRLELHEQNKRLKLSSRVFSDTHEGIVISDADNLIIDVNPTFCDITGYSREDVIGQNIRMLSSGKQSPGFYQDMWRAINENSHWQGELWNRKKNGELYAELLTVSVIRDEFDEVINYVGVFTDITSSKRQQEQLSIMAHYDVLTGLPNRALFVDRFSQAIAHSKRTKRQLAVCFLDLDNFKPINDNYGHEVGDKLLVEVAKRIVANIREEDTVSRQGGDEFALLLNDIESFSQCEQTLQRIHDAIAQPYTIDGYSPQITASSGVTLYPRDDGDIDTLLRHADQAMYKVKLEGKHCYHLFNPEEDKRTIEKHHHLDEIEHALVNKHFQLYYQPKVNMATGDVFGVEALMRWIHPEKGLIPPLDFLPSIEGTELEIKVGNWVINQALSQLEVWSQQGIHLEVSINISSNHLLSGSFFDQLDAALTKHSSVDSQCLQLEILESSALGDLSAISTIIESCQSVLGVKVALDDFGTGYSSLTHLRHLPVDTIKIDQSFVRDMLCDPSDYAIIDGIIGLSGSFSREIIAEGVESTDHGLMLLMIGCEEAQGYAIAKPMPADEYLQWVAHYTPNQAWQQCGNTRRSKKETKIKLFRLVAKYWKDAFINNIKSSPEEVEHWPIMDGKHCSCGSWITRAQQEQLFEAESLMQLETAHNAFHLVAQALLLQYQNGNLDVAREGLTELQAALNNMDYILEGCAV